MNMQSTPISTASSLYKANPVHDNLRLTAAELEAPMPQPEELNLVDKSKSLVWMATALLILVVYIGLPLAAAADGLVRSFIVDALWSILVIVGIGLLVLDTLKRTDGR